MKNIEIDDIYSAIHVHFSLCLTPHVVLAGGGA